MSRINVAVSKAVSAHLLTMSTEITTTGPAPRFSSQCRVRKPTAGDSQTSNSGPSRDNVPAKISTSGMNRIAAASD